MPAGRPPAFATVEEMQQAIDAYFRECDMADPPKPYTMCGLAESLGVDRQTVVNYGAKEKFFGTVKAARTKVERFAEERLFGTGQVAGVIFSLKNNFDWEDRNVNEHAGKVKVDDARESLRNRIGRNASEE